MICFAFFVFFIFTFSVSQFSRKFPKFGVFAHLTVSLNLVLFLITLFKDPGIKKSIYKHHLKVIYGFKTDEMNELESEDENEENTDEEEDDDLEANNDGDKGLKQRRGGAYGELNSDEMDEECQRYRKFIDDRTYMPRNRIYNGKVYLFCEKCNQDVPPDAEHCDDCQVCIDGMDHHCIFYSKCIGRGNVWPFYLTLFMIFLNFGLIIYGSVTMETIPRDTE